VRRGVAGARALRHRGQAPTPAGAERRISRRTHSGRCPSCSEIGGRTRAGSRPGRAASTGGWATAVVGRPCARMGRIAQRSRCVESGSRPVSSLLPTTHFPLARGRRMIILDCRGAARSPCGTGPCPRGSRRAGSRGRWPRRPAHRTWERCAECRGDSSEAVSRTVWRSRNISIAQRDLLIAIAWSPGGSGSLCEPCATQRLPRSPPPFQRSARKCRRPSQAPWLRARCR
jgi:hypothetical protein